MAIHKREEFNSGDQQISMVAKAISHPARIAILRILASHDNFTTGEIVELLPLAQPTISHHLKELQAAQLITMTNIGKKCFYQINLSTWQGYQEEMAHLATALNKKD